MIFQSILITCFYGAEQKESPGDGHEHVTVNKSQTYRQGTQLNAVSVLGGNIVFRRRN